MLHLKRVRVFLARMCATSRVECPHSFNVCPISEMFVCKCPLMPLCYCIAPGNCRRKGIEFARRACWAITHPHCRTTFETAEYNGWSVHALWLTVALHSSLQVRPVPQTPPPDSAGRLSSGAQPIDQTTIGCRFGSSGQGFDSRFWAIPFLESRFHADLCLSDAKFD